MPDDAPKKPVPFDAPPNALTKRRATVQLGKTNTLRFPGDLRRDDPGPWYQGAMPRPPTQGNTVRFLVDGPTAILAMFKAIDATVEGPDYILMLNWWVDPFLQVTGFADRLGELLAKKLKQSVLVRAMYWASPTTSLPWPFSSDQNVAMVTLLNRGRVERDGTVIEYLPKGTPNHSRRNGAAILDGRLNAIDVGPITTSVGSHHQKMLCVKAAGTLVAFCGGIDFNRDRLEMNGVGAPLHDVHCRVVGPAATSLVQTFVDRWTDHPESAPLDAEVGTGVPWALPGNSDDLDPDKQPKDGRHSVQLGRTFGGGPLVGGQGPTLHYAFAPRGEKSSRALVTNAIQNAKKCIYLEDQYFVSLEAARLLADALGRIEQLTIVVPHHKLGDLPMMVGYRKRCIAILQAADPTKKKFRIFYKCGPGEKPGDYETYVHSKMTIVDDEFAVIGSVNYNRRSWHHDSEMSIGVYDPSNDRVLTNRFAHWLRMRIWAEHLFGTIAPPSLAEDPVALKDGTYAEVFDPIAAGAHWAELQLLQDKWRAANPNTPLEDYDQSKFNSVATVRPYNVSDPPEEIKAVPFFSNIPILGIVPNSLLNSDYGWDTFLDPVGS